MLARVENLIQKTTIMRCGNVADKPWSRLLGLIGTMHHPLNDGLLILPCSGLHSMFMYAPVDVLHVDDAHRVIAINERIVPNNPGQVFTGQPFTGQPSARQLQSPRPYVIEVPAGTIARTRTNVGDLLQIVFVGVGVQAATDRSY